MAYSKIESTVWSLAEPIADSNGFYLYDVEYLKEGGIWFLRVYIDKDGGISIDECETFSRALSDVLDKKDPIDKNYYLEVSSPGIERKLKTEAHFKRYMGDLIDVGLYKPIDGCKTITGVLKDYNGSEITVEASDKEIVIPLSSASVVHLHFDF